MAAWDEITSAIGDAPYPVSVLPPDGERAQRCLATLGITTGSWLGAVVANTGGIVVDHGWLRVFGSGHGELPDVLWTLQPPLDQLTVAVDALGGQYIWIQAAADRTPTIHYFGPDELDWMDTGHGYGSWLAAVLRGVLTDFYETLRWPGWQTEVAALSLAQGIHTFPPPFTVEGRNLAQVSRAAVPMAELISFHHDAARQLGG
jgi:hypothetical protein